MSERNGTKEKRKPAGVSWADLDTVWEPAGLRSLADELLAASLCPQTLCGVTADALAAGVDPRDLVSAARMADLELFSQVIVPMVRGAIDGLRMIDGREPLFMEIQNATAGGPA